MVFASFRYVTTINVDRERTWHTRTIVDIDNRYALCSWISYLEHTKKSHLLVGCFFVFVFSYRKKTVTYTIFSMIIIFSLFSCLLSYVAVFSYYGYMFPLRYYDVQFAHNMLPYIAWDLGARYTYTVNVNDHMKI